MVGCHSALRPSTNVFKESKVPSLLVGDQVASNSRTSRRHLFKAAEICAFVSTLTASRIVVALPGANTLRCERHKDWDGGGCAQCSMLLVTRDEVVLRCLSCVFFVSWPLWLAQDLTGPVLFCLGPEHDLERLPWLRPSLGKVGQWEGCPVCSLVAEFIATGLQCVQHARQGWTTSRQLPQ